MILNVKINKRIFFLNSIYRYSNLYFCFACKFDIEWTVRKADIKKNKFPLKICFRPLVRITTNVLNFLTRHRTIVFFKKEKDLLG